MKTKVIFRKFKKSGDIIAFFPWERNYLDMRYCESYMQVGQHGEATYPHSNTIPAKPEEYASLKAELESIGYNLEIKTRKVR